MASGGTLTMDKSLPGKMEGLKVRGTAISPAPGSGATEELSVPAQASDLGMTSHMSSAASAEDDDDLRSLASSDAYNVLQSVVNVNQTLENQIAALRLRLDVEAKQHRSEKSELAAAKDKLISDKEQEMEELRDSLAAREERISVLVKSSEDKDRQISDKMAEIDELRQLVQQTESYAKELGKQVTRLRVEKRHLESDAIYREQNQEIARLKKELQLLRERLASMETELKRAHKIIEQQNSRVAELDADKTTMHARFKEELDKASRAMRQEVERMREVMKQNYEEIRNLREQNHEMHDDVREIKEMLLKGKTPRPEPLKSTATTDINLSRYVTVRPPPTTRAQSPSKGVGHLNRRSLEQLSVNMHRTPRYPPSPSASPTRARPPVPRPPGSSVSRSSHQSGAAGLPPIASMKDGGGGGNKWVPAGRAPSNLSSATSRRTAPRK